MKDDREPTLLTIALFTAKASILQILRMLEDRAKHIECWQSVNPNSYPHLLCESRTPLWSDTTLSERSLQLGKVENLRCALRHLQHITIPTGGLFSFWKHIGRATRRRGFVDGRQISEGCLIPAIGGGLCQLSNALYDVALQMGAEIVERHAHSRIVPGSSAEEGRDATVFWNYIDLRFRPQIPIRLHTYLTSDTLVVQVFTQKPTPKSSSLVLSLKLREVISVAAHSCQSCGRTSCFRHKVTLPAIPYDPMNLQRTAYFLEEYWEEFQQYVVAHVQKCDTVCIPLEGERWKRPNYRWRIPPTVPLYAATLATLRRAYQTRNSALQGAARQTALLEGAEALARTYAKTLTPDITHLRISQVLLPYLWRDGHLGGRTFDVFLTRQPILHLQALLDSAAQRFPERKTLTDFRAPDWVASAEQEALQSAQKVITPHTYLASLFPDKVERLAWCVPNVEEGLQRGTQVLFPAPVVARKGAYEVREALRNTRGSVYILGRELEGEGFWEGVERVHLEQVNWEKIGCVVLPALVEDKPSLLLQALARGIPVVTTPQCGLPESSLVSLVPYGEVAPLHKALRECQMQTR